MKRFLFSCLAISFLLLANAPAAPLEFFARVVEKNPVDSLNTVLRVEITPSVIIDVSVTTLTELKDGDGNLMTIDDLEVGALVEIDAVFTPAGFLALEIQIQEAGEGFEVKGPLEEVDEAGSWIRVQGLTVLVNDETRLRDENREPISLGDLAERLAASSPLGLLVKVEGSYGEDGLVAASIKIVTNQRFARISLEGVIAEVLSESQFILELGGGTRVLVNILPETSLVGEPFSGLYVRVIGSIAPDLSVNAHRIRVLGLFELSPDELEMEYSETRDVTVLLRIPLEQDLVLQIASADPAVATAAPEVLTIPAGEMSATFQVTAGTADGRTAVTVSAGDEFGGYARRLRVEVGEGGSEDRPIEIEWTPRVVRAAPNGWVNVRVMVKHGLALQDLPLTLELVDASADLQLRYPSEAVILEGQKSVDIPLLFGSQTGSGKLVARLPEDQGGDSAELDIDLRSNSQSAMKVSWGQSRVAVPAETDFSVRLSLSQIAREDVPVVITPMSGNRGVLDRMEAQVVIPAGEQSTEVSFRSSGEAGRLRLRAALPRALGGDHADLDIRVQ